MVIRNSWNSWDITLISLRALPRPPAGLDPKSISELPKKEWLIFVETLFTLLECNAKKMV